MTTNRAARSPSSAPVASPCRRGNIISKKPSLTSASGKALLDYIASSFRRAGIPDAEARAARVLALETEIASRQWSTAEQRDVVRMNHVMTPAELKAYAPGFPWDA